MCSTLKVKGVKNAQKYKMVERLTECKHATMGIVTEIKAPESITLEAASRKRARLEKINEIAVAVQERQGDLHVTQQENIRLLARRDGREEKMHQLEQVKIRAEIENNRIDSYCKLQNCLIQANVHPKESPMHAELNQDIANLIELKRKLAKKLFEEDST